MLMYNRKVIDVGRYSRVELINGEVPRYSRVELINVTINKRCLWRPPWAHTGETVIQEYTTLLKINRK